ncbi:MAG: homoserine kinase [Deltaproteobacteria bacterium]|nr:homoserine kinase [Deltaproteobacteria bacterium]MBU49947.1 homoserine kinase [Deltaproteobacteria bacterium]
MQKRVRVFAPASAANLGPGYDLLGVAIGGVGDEVEVRLAPEADGLFIESIEGDGGRLPLKADENTAGIAALEVLKLLGKEDVGIALHLKKGLPLGSGLGSSGASAAAAVQAINVLFGEPLEKKDMLHATMVAEASVSGWHADNVAASLFGGLILIRSYEPLDWMRFDVPEAMRFVLVKPDTALETKKARAAVPTEIPIKQHIANSGNLAAMIGALGMKDIKRFGAAIQDVIVEPARAPLIPGFHAVKRAALEAGAYGCSISGAGPTIFAIVDSDELAQRVAKVMQDAFMQDAQLDSFVTIGHVDLDGARQIDLPVT